MRRRVATGIASGRTSAVAAAALIGFLILYAALPLCSSAFTCTMPCCADSDQPMEGHDAMPASNCGGSASDCAVTGAVSTDVTTIVLASNEAAVAVPAAAPRSWNDLTLHTNGTHPSLVTPRANVRHLYVLHDVFLI